MEVMVRDQLKIFKNKKVFVTGHTGFKGSWLVLTLQELGCEVYGYALAPETTPNHYELNQIQIDSTLADIRDLNKLTESLHNSKAEIVFHLAAQSLVRPSYSDPSYTYDVNVMGSLQVLQAVRSCQHVNALVMITTDKVYENREINYAYKETDRLGGYDIYSSSKACCEILIDSYRNSFFNLQKYGADHKLLIASVRAGNVIGGGDWCVDRLIPDLMKAASQNQEAIIRNPLSIRPWQHVLDCISGYLLIGAHLLNENKSVAKAWNISPEKDDVMNVESVIKLAQSGWSKIKYIVNSDKNNPHEANLLMLDNSEIKNTLQWKPVFSTSQAIQITTDWYKQYYTQGEILSSMQINKYLNASWN